MQALDSNLGTNALCFVKMDRIPTLHHILVYLISLSSFAQINGRVLITPCNAALHKSARAAVIGANAGRTAKPFL